MMNDVQVLQEKFEELQKAWDDYRDKVLAATELPKVQYPEASSIFGFRDPSEHLFDSINQELGSKTQKLTDTVLDSIMNTRKQILDNFVKDPGFVSTFGDDFTLEFQEPEIVWTRSIDFENPLDDIVFTVKQRYRIRRRSTLEADLIEQDLRKNPDGSLESV